MNRHALPLLAVSAIVLAACGAAGGGSPGQSPGGGPSDRPADDDGVIISIAHTGGFAPPDWIARQMPSAVILADGRVILQGAQIEIFPQPTLPPLQVRRLSEEGIRTIVDAIAATELFTEDLRMDGAMNFVADAPDTEFTVDRGDGPVLVSVYGLGALDPTNPQGVPAAEVQAHRVLLDLQEKIMAIDTWLPPEAWAEEAWQPYEPEAFRLFIVDPSTLPIDPAVPQPVREWPMAEAPDAVGEPAPFFGETARCLVVTGEDAATWFTELASANQLTTWETDDGTAVGIIPRPLLPFEEPACGELGGAS